MYMCIYVYNFQVSLKVLHVLVHPKHALFVHKKFILLYNICTHSHTSVHINFIKLKKLPVKLAMLAVIII